MSDPAAAHDEPQAQPLSLRASGRLRACAGLIFTEFGEASSMSAAAAFERLRRGADADHPFAIADALAGQEVTATNRRAGSSCLPTTQRRRACRRIAIWRRLPLWTALSGGVAALLVMAVLVALFRGSVRPGEQAIEILLLNGAVSVITGPERHLASRNEILAPGSLLLTGPMSSARLRYADGTVLDVTANARLGNIDRVNALGAQKALRLEAGTVHAEVTHQPEGRPLLIATADAEAVVLGTRLILDTKTSDTRLSVEKGLVRLVRTFDRESVEVPAGKRVVAEETGALIVQDSPTPPPPVERSSSPVHDGTGSGLTGDYFNGIELADRVLTRIDPEINFDWGFESAPVSVLNSEFYSVRWHGQIEARFSEEYLISTLSDDGVRLWIDGKLLIDNWFEHPELAQSAHIELSAGRRYAIVFEYCEWKRYALVHLFWQSRHQGREVVPRCQLYPEAMPTPAPSPTAAAP
jgi:ferric-dicitrate binding protein FerR (iron transport regulator)